MNPVWAIATILVATPLRPEPPHPPIATLLAGLHAPDVPARVKAIDGFQASDYADPRVVPALAAVALDDPDDYVRFEASYRLAKNRPAGDAAVSIFYRALRSSNPAKRKYAIEAVAHSRPDLVGLSDTLAVRLADPSADVRLAAAYGLAEIKPLSHAALTALHRAMRSSDDKLAEAAENALRNGGDPVIPIVRADLNDRDAKVRARALMVLPRTGAAAIPLIVAAAKDPDVEVRGIAAMVLAFHEPRTKEIADALLALSGDPELAVLDSMGTFADPDTFPVYSSIEHVACCHYDADTTSYTFSVTTKHYQDRGMFSERQEKGRFFEVFVQDLAGRKAPRRVLRRSLGPKDRASVLSWPAEGMLLLSEGSGGRVAELVDPATGSARRLPSAHFDALNAIRARRPGTPGANPENVRNVTENLGEFFAWDPVHRRKRLIYTLPADHDGFADTNADNRDFYRKKGRFTDTLARLGEVSVTEDRDSLRFRLPVSAPRPGRVNRTYVVDIRMDVPDTTEEHMNHFASLEREVTQRKLVLVPETESLVIAVSRDRLAAVLAPYRRSMTIRKPVHGTMACVRLRPLPNANDPEKIPPGILDANANTERVWIEVPVH